MTKKVCRFESHISQELKSNKIREIKKIMLQYPEANKNATSYFDHEGVYVIEFFEPSFIEKLKSKKHNKSMERNNRKYQSREKQIIKDNLR